MRKSIYTLVPGEEPIELVDYYSDFISYYPECELQTKRWFVENIEKEWVIFDVGANIGYYSILFSRLASMGRVFAFEPTETITKLKANIDCHGCSNVTAFNTALGAREGKIEENIYRIWGRPPERRIYKFSTIDDMVNKLGLTRLDCVKIDVDSFDLDNLVILTRLSQKARSFKEMTCWASAVYRGLRKHPPILAKYQVNRKSTSRSVDSGSSDEDRGAPTPDYGGSANQHLSIYNSIYKS